MTELDQLQDWMTRALQQRRAVERDATLAAEARAKLSGNDRVSPEAQLETYREQFWLRHTSALVEDFEALGTVLGQAAWERLVEEYFASHPPDSFTLRDLGARLPEFVRAAAWLPHHALATDLARVEWAYVEAFDAADCAPLDGARLAAIPESAWEHARFELAPSVQLLSLGHPAPALRRDIRLKRDFALPDPSPCHVVIYRSRARELHHETLDELAFELLQRLRDGDALVPAAEAVLALHPGPSAEARLEAELGGWFQHFAARGFISDVIVESP